MIANSIGAFFTILSLADKKIERAFFISPIVDMKKLIQNMMRWAGVTIEELQKKGEILTVLGKRCLGNIIPMYVNILLNGSTNMHIDMERRII